MENLQHIIEQKRELIAREIFSRSAFDCSEGMSEDRKVRYISYLVDRVNDLELDKKAMELVLEDFLHTQKEMKEEQAEMKKKQDQMDSKLDEEIMKSKKAEQKAEKLEAQLEFAKKNKFGDKQQKVNKTDDENPSEENSDRNNEKDNFDGTDDTPETKSVSEPSDTPEPKKERKRDLSKRPDTYNAMGVQGDPIEHPSDATKVPGRIPRS